MTGFMPNLHLPTAQVQLTSDVKIEARLKMPTKSEEWLQLDVAKEMESQKRGEGGVRGEVNIEEGKPRWRISYYCSTTTAAVQVSLILLLYKISLRCSKIWTKQRFKVRPK